MLNSYSQEQHILPLNLQMFAEEPQDTPAQGIPASTQKAPTQAVADTKPDETKSGNKAGDGKDGKGKPNAPKEPENNKVQMTQAEFDAEMARRAERARKKGFEEGKQAGTDEAERLKDMTEAERKDYTIKQLQARIDSDEQERTHRNLVDQTAKMFTNDGLNVTTDEIATFFVGKDADETSAKYKKAVAMIDRLVNEKRKQNIQGIESKPHIDNSNSHLEDPVEIGKELAKNRGSQGEQSKWFMK